MIPKRVLLHHPPSTKASPAIAKKCPKGLQTDWDSPSSYTGTVKRRPPSLEATKILLSPINIDCDDDENNSSNSTVAVDCSSTPTTTTTSATTFTCTSVGVTASQKDVDDSLSAPQEIVQGNCFRNEKNQAGITTNSRQESCSSKNKTSESQPINGASTLQRKSKLKPPTPTTNQLVSKSSNAAWQPLATASSKTNLPKLSQIKKTQQFVCGKTKATANNPQLVKLKTASSYISTSGKIKSVTALHTKLDASELNKNKSKLGVGKLRYSNPLVSPTKSSTFTELYRDYPVDFASTTVVESIPLQPPPYCNPPSPPYHPQFKQKNHESEGATPDSQNKIILLQKNNDKLLQSVGLAPDVVCPNAPTHLTTSKLANEIHRFKGNFPLQKFPSISKLSTRSYRFLSSPATIKSSSDFALNKNGNEEDDKFPFKRINRVRSNDYVLFNPTRLNNGGSPVKMAAAAEKSPTYDHLAKPEFTSSLFKNIPVRPRKGIPHLENYCLFDPNTDFVNEKELQLQQKHIRDDEYAGLPLPDSEIDDDELIEEIIYEDQLLYDTLDVEDEPAPCGFITKIDEVTESSSSSQLTSSESDAMQSSVIETSSPNVDSSPLQCPPTLPSLAIVEIIQKSDRLFRHSSLPIPTTPTTPSTRTITFTDDSSRSNEFADTESSVVQNQNKVNFVASGVTSFTPSSLQEQQSLKQSVSSPQLQNASKVRNKSLPLGESNYVLFHPAPVHSRTQYKIRQPRPISTHSDADSGFLSPVTPDGTTAAATETKFNPAILVLQQCDSIQGYIEVIENENLIFHIEFSPL